MENAGLADRFEHLLAADQAQANKPSPELYAGAAQFGLRTAWLARGRESSWVLGARPDIVVESPADLA